MGTLAHSPWIQKAEHIVERMLKPISGVDIRTIQGFLTKVHGVVTGCDITTWLRLNVRGVDDIQEALHLAFILAIYGYLYPAEHDFITMRNDKTLYRIQSRRYWISEMKGPDDIDYAIYLVKRRQHSGGNLEDDEVKTLHKFKRLFEGQWTCIKSQADSEYRVERKREKVHRKILSSQERAFWRLLRPPAGVVTGVELDLRQVLKTAIIGKAPPRCIRACPKVTGDYIDVLLGTIKFMRKQIHRQNVKVSKVCKALMKYTEDCAQFDPFINKDSTMNSWVHESQGQVLNNRLPGEASLKARCAKWSLSMENLLKDPDGRCKFRSFLQDEVSSENIDFLMAVKDLKDSKERLVRIKVTELFMLYFTEESHQAVNVDASILASIKESIDTKPDRYTYDSAEEHIFNLLKSDCYPRFIKSPYNSEVTKRGHKTGSCLKLSLI